MSWIESLIIGRVAFYCFLNMKIIFANQKKVSTTSCKFVERLPFLSLIQVPNFVHCYEDLIPFFQLLLICFLIFDFFPCILHAFWPTSCFFLCIELSVPCRRRH